LGVREWARQDTKSAVLYKNKDQEIASVRPPYEG